MHKRRLTPIGHVYYQGESNMLDPLGYVCRFRALRAHPGTHTRARIGSSASGTAEVSPSRLFCDSRAHLQQQLRVSMPHGRHRHRPPPPRSCVEDWRSKWRDSAQPFLFVQLPPGGGPHFVALRAAQASQQAGFGASGIRRKWDSA